MCTRNVEECSKVIMAKRPKLETLSANTKWVCPLMDSHKMHHSTAISNNMDKFKNFILNIYIF